MKLNISRTLFILSIASTGLLRAQGVPIENPSTVVAEVNGSTVTLGELEESRSHNLFQAREAYYKAQKKALDDLLDERLLQLQAKKENLTVDQLIERHVTSQIKKDPTDDQLQIFYESLETDQPLEAVKGDILKQLRDLRISKAKAAYMKTLRAEAKMSVTLPEPRIEVTTEGKVLFGPQNAPVKLVEFADYQCPYCRQLEPTLERLRTEFGDKVAFVYKDYPIPGHTLAPKAAEAADCAAVQGKFWEFHDYLFKDTKNLEVAGLKSGAKELNLDQAKFESCLDRDGKNGEIRRDLSEGSRLGISGTPALFINGRYMAGAAKYETLRDVIQQELAAASSPARQTAQR